MKPVILGPLLTVVVATGALLVFRAGETPGDAPLAKRGPDSRDRRALRERPAWPDAGMAALRQAESDPHAALAEARSIGPEAVTALLAGWAARDAEAAEQWAMALAGEERDAALGVLVVEFGTRDAVRALRLAERISEPVARGQAIGFALAQQAQADPGSVFTRMAESGENEEVRALAEKVALPALAEVDPLQVAHWLAAGKATPQGTEAALVATVQRWTQQDAEAAAQWVASFDDERLLREAMGPLMQLWMRQGTERPAVWIEELEPGMAQEEARAAYAAALSPQTANRHGSSR